METVIVDRESGSRRVMQSCVGESRTEQHHANEVNINQIVARYTRTGVMPSRGGVPSYGDFAGVSDYHSAVEAVRAADAQFMLLDPHIRERFANDPGRLLEFLADPRNREEAVRLGLVAAADVSVEPQEKASETPQEVEKAVKPAET